MTIEEARDAEILDLFEAGNQRGLARAISRAESGRGEGLVHALFGRSGHARTVGLTGPPGVGKSTLTSRLVSIARAEGRDVGVVSVDPSSPFSHGAILGDRIRLSDHFTDAGVFIRSMASRGHLGGLAGASGDAVMLMDAFGLNAIFIETVGVGQSEIEIAELADTTVVVLQPGSGDSVQLLKAGILEIADIFVVNKADHPMALQLRREIRSMMEMLDFKGWVPRLVSTRAHDGDGVDELWKALGEHADYLRASGELVHRRQAAFAHRVRALVMGEIERRVEPSVEACAAGAGEHSDPYRAAASLLEPLAPVLPPPRDGKAERPRPGRATVRGL